MNLKPATIKTQTRTQYKNLLKNIGQTIAVAKSEVVQQINNGLVKSNWEIGRHIVEFEQQGQERAEYGSALLERLSEDLKLRHGKGFGRRNILDMRRFYLTFTKWQTVSAKLSWSHYIALLSVSDSYERQFYLKHSINEKLSVRDLERQIDSSLFERLALSRDKKGVLKLANKGNIVTTPTEALKNPFVFDFLGIAKLPRVSEKMLEQKLIDNLQQLLLELGKGFTFVARQFKFSLRNKHYYIDLVFYHRILRCFVLIDLKAKKVSHQDIGQMNLYLNYFKAEENVDGDKEPVGIILSKDKDEIMVEYAMGSISNKIFVSKYQLYLPDKKQLQQSLKFLINNK
jgi:predicted nuclease of restriction endonuclease-like (RecB) superfamily